MKNAYEHFNSILLGRFSPFARPQNSRRILCSYLLKNNDELVIHRDENGYYHIFSSMENLLSYQLEPKKIKTMELYCSSTKRETNVLAIINNMSSLETLEIIIDPQHGECYDKPTRLQQLRSLFTMSLDIIKSVLNKGGLKKLIYSIETSDITDDVTQIFLVHMHNLPELISKSKHLSHLSFTGIFLNSIELGKFFKPMIGKTAHINHLAIRGLNTEIGSPIPNADDRDWWTFLESNTSLKSLKLQYDNFNITGVHKLILATKTHTNLACLDFNISRNDGLEFILLPQIYTLLEDHPIANIIHPILRQRFQNIHPIVHQKLQSILPPDAFSNIDRGIIKSYLVKTKITNINLSTIYLPNDLGDELFTHLKDNAFLFSIQLNEVYNLKISWIIDLMGNESLRELIISRSEIDNRGLLRISEALIQNSTLSSLSLFHNTFDNATALKSLCKILDGNSSLNRFKFYIPIQNDNHVYPREELAGIPPSELPINKYRRLVQSLKKNCSLWDCSNVSTICNNTSLMTIQRNNLSFPNEFNAFIRTEFKINFLLQHAFSKPHYIIFLSTPLQIVIITALLCMKDYPEEIQNIIRVAFFWNLKINHKINKK